MRFTLTVIGAEVLGEDEGGGIAVRLWMDNDDGARVLAGLIGRDIELDLEQTLATQPDPQRVFLVPRKGRKDG